MRPMTEFEFDPDRSCRVHDQVNDKMFDWHTAAIRFQTIDSTIAFRLAAMEGQQTAMRSDHRARGDARLLGMLAPPMY